VVVERAKKTIYLEDKRRQRSLWGCRRIGCCGFTILTKGSCIKKATDFMGWGWGIYASESL